MCGQLSTGSLCQAGRKDAWLKKRPEPRTEARYQNLLYNKQKSLKVVGFCDVSKSTC